MVNRIKNLNDTNIQRKAKQKTSLSNFRKAIVSLVGLMEHENITSGIFTEHIEDVYKACFGLNIKITLKK